MGTRGSALALAQSGWLAGQLKSAHPGLEVETVIIKTSGDRFSEQSPQQAHALGEGTKGLFVKEIEEALTEKRIDFAVHSAKDMPAALALGLGIAAYPQREDPRDAFIGGPGITIAGLKAGLRVATSSARRGLQLNLAWPGLQIVPMRGNVDTRLKKLGAGQCDGLILAAAGLKRLGRSDVACEPFPVDLMLPSPGQGALSVEARQSHEEVWTLLSVLDHVPTRRAVEMERVFLAALGGGCTMPLGALALPEGHGMRLHGFWAEPDGRRARRMSKACVDMASARSCAEELAAEIRRG